MVMVSLAWTLKAWCALMLPATGRWQSAHQEQKQSLLKMEFKAFAAGLIRLPCQIITTGRRRIYRLLSWNPWTGSLLNQVRLLPFVLLEYNPHTQFVRLIERAGLNPWPKVWQNLRSTRETELLKDFPIHVVCGWIGNTERIGRRHYFQTTEADFDKAVGVQRAAKSAAISSSEYAQLAQVKTKEPRFPAENAINAVLSLSSCAQDRI